MVSRATTRPAFNLAYPLKDRHGAIAGVISVGFVIDRYREILNNMSLLPGTSYVLSDHRGVVLSRAIDPERYIGTPYPANEFRKIQEGPDSGTSIRAGIAGDKRIISYRKLRLAGEQAPYMYLTAGIPLEVAVHGADRALRNNMALFSSFLLLACAGAALIGKRSIADPVRLLERASERVAAGDLQVRVSDLVTGGELGNLGQRFDAMAEKLASREAERRKAEEERDRLVSILETTTDVVSMANPEGTIIYFNRAGRELTGIDGLPSLTIALARVHPEWAAEQIMKVGVPTAIREGSWQGETALLDRDGREIPVSQVILSHRDVQGNLSYLSTIMRDTSERNRHVQELIKREKALEESQGRLGAAISISQIGFFDHDHRTNNIYWSPMQRKIHGWGPDEAVTLTGFMGLILPEDYDNVMATISRAHDPSGDGVWDLEHRILRRDGSIRWLKERSQTFFEGEGNAQRAIRTVGAVMDITERKLTEEERILLTQQLIQAQKMESIGRLAGGVAHDFNNLLTPIISYSEILMEDMPDNKAAHAKIGNILKATEKAKGLVQQLLSFSRKQTLEMKTLDLNEVIEAFHGILRHTIRESIDIRLDLTEEPYGIRADRNQIEQVIMNLGVNAQDAVGEQGIITIETAPVLLDDEYTHQHPDVDPGRYMMLAITDNGSGMDLETRRRIFEPFFTTKGVGKGTGLGLATVYGIVRQHGGNIWVYSEAGQGTTFKCYFPIVDEMPIREEPAVPEQVSLAGGRRTILLVEDNEMVRTVVHELLLRRGFEVLVAQDPEQALRMSGSQPLDLLITDVVMPYMTGPELHTKMLVNYPRLKALYMSGYTSNVITQHGVLEEGIRYIQKPFAITGFLKTVEALLGS